MAKVTDVQSIIRALRVIEVLNQSSVTSVEAAHRLTGIPKPTLIRLFGTLATAGYVSKVSRRDGYALTSKVLRLSAGFRYDDAIVDIARPLFETFSREHKWQLTLATLDTDAMLIRYNTRHVSPFAPHLRFLNRRLNIRACAVGRAYLAYCSQAERDIIVTFLRASGQAEDLDIDTLIEAIRSRRYATRERLADDNARSFAIPILSIESGVALASMAVSYFASAMTEAQATGRYLEEMYAIAGEIASALSRMRSDPDAPGALQRA